MGLKDRNMVVNVFGNTQLSLQAKTGESILVKAIKIFNPLTNYVTVSTEKTTVGYFRVGNTLGNHLDFPANDRRDGMNLLDYLFSMEIFTGYPVAEGETFKLEGIHQAGSIVSIIYDLYDAGDITNAMENGSISEEFFFVNYGTTGAAIVAAGSATLDTTINPAEFNAFPFGADVPAKTELMLFAIAASEHGTGAAGPTDNLGTEYLKFIRDRTVLFDEDKNGLPMRRDAAALTADAIAGGQSIIGNHSDTDPRPPYMLPEPMIFTAGEELNALLTYGGLTGTPSLGVDQQEVALVFKQRRV